MIELIACRRPSSWLLICALAVASAACGGTSAAPTREAHPPSPEPSAAAEMTLAEAEEIARRTAELLAELIASVQATEGDCAKLVPTYTGWETKHEQERSRLDGLGWEIPAHWVDDELSSYYTEIKAHQLTMIRAISACRSDPGVRDVFGVDEADKEPVPPNTMPVVPSLDQGAR